MTLLEMANYVTDKVRQTDAAALARCKGFLRRRYEMIWNEALWRASVWRHDFTFDPEPSFSAQPPFGNYWSNPPYTDLDTGETTGGGVQMLPEMVDRVLALRRADAGVPAEMSEGLFRCAVDDFEEAGQPTKFLVLPPAVLDIQRNNETDIESEGISITVDAADAGQEMLVRYRDFDGERQEETLTLIAGVQTMGGYPQTFLSVTKEVTGAAVAFSFDTDALFSIGAARTSATVRGRIRLVPRPTAATAFKCLVKKKPEALTADGDEPELAGVENCLMTFAQRDMLQHARQYGKAQVVDTEALALLEQFKRMEVVQQAGRQRVTPDVTDYGHSFPESKGWYS